MQSEMVDYGHQVLVDILQMGAHDVIDDIETDILILLDKNIPEADHGDHFLGQLRLYGPLLIAAIIPFCIRSSRNLKSRHWTSLVPLKEWFASLSLSKMIFSVFNISKERSSPASCRKMRSTSLLSSLDISTW